MTVQEFAAKLNRSRGNNPARVDVLISAETSGELYFGPTRMGSVLFESDGSVKSVVLLPVATMELVRLINRVHPDLKVS